MLKLVTNIGETGGTLLKAMETVINDCVASL